MHRRRWLPAINDVHRPPTVVPRLQRPDARTAFVRNNFSTPAGAPSQGGRSMRTNRWITSVSVVAVAALLGWECAMAQQVTGTPGSPSATTTIEGGQLPPPPQKFDGKIERNAGAVHALLARRASFRPRVPPTCCLIMTDDTGFGAHQHLRGRHPDARRSTASLRMACAITDFNSTALCSPYAGRAHLRAQSSLDGLRGRRRAVDWLPRLQQHHGAGTRRRSGGS